MSYGPGESPLSYHEVDSDEIRRALAKKAEDEEARAFAHEQKEQVAKAELLNRKGRRLEYAKIRRALKRRRKM